MATVPTADHGSVERIAAQRSMIRASRGIVHHVQRPFLGEILTVNLLPIVAHCPSTMDKYATGERRWIRARAPPILCSDLLPMSMQASTIVEDPTTGSG